jgi:cytochrome b561
MARIAADRRYSSGAIAFHWTIAGLVIFNLLVGLLHDAVPPVRALMPAHKAVGITVLALSVLRVAWRLAHRPPPLPADVRGWERGAAHAMHWLLYLLIIVMPLTGWAMSGGAKPHPFTWLGLPVPLLPVSDGAADGAWRAHVVLGWTMAGLVAIHIAAALRHHWLLRDAVLARMAPELAIPARAADAR